MNKKNLNFLIVFIFLIVATLKVSAFSPFADSSGSLSISSVHPNILRFNSSNELYFHIYNSSGNWLNTSQYTCVFHLYNWSNGQHLYEGNVGNHSTTESEYILNYSYITDKKKYDYIIYCSGTGSQTEKGYLKNYFILTSTGEEITYQEYVFSGLLMILPILFAFLILYWTFNLGEEHSVLKIGLSLFSVTNIFLSLLFALETLVKFFEWEQMQDIITTSLWIYGILLFVLFSYWFMYLIKKATETIAEDKEKRLDY